MPLGEPNRWKGKSFGVMLLVIGTSLALCGNKLHAFCCLAPAKLLTHTGELRNSGHLKYGEVVGIDAIWIPLELQWSTARAAPRPVCGPCSGVVRAITLASFVASFRI